MLFLFCGKIKQTYLCRELRLMPPHLTVHTQHILRVVYQYNIGVEKCLKNVYLPHNDSNNKFFEFFSYTHMKRH